MLQQITISAHFDLDLDVATIYESNQSDNVAFSTSTYLVFYSQPVH